jgi:hypothetical protein
LKRFKMANSKRRDNVVVNFFVGLAAASLVLTQSEAGTISDSLMEKLQTQGKSDAVLELPSVMSKVMSNPMMGFLQGDAKVSMMTSLMQQFTSASQAPFMSAIQSFGIANQVEPFFITNKLSMQNVDLPVLQALAKVPGTFTIREPTQVKLIRAVNSELLNVSTRAEPAEWGVKKIEAPSVWSSTTRGENVVVAGIDTGVRGTHEALVKNYGGAFYDGMNDRTVEPYDDDGHGTHTMGTIAGQNGIGVAPGAKWIACKGLGPNGGSDVTLSRCAQWLIKQRPLPKVVCNSWGGGQNDGFFNDEIDAWHGAGIIPVFAIGNEGSGCQTAGSPGDQDNVISVGATDSSDKITSFSSRGYAKGTRRMKPEVSAPGARIRSAFNKADNSYATLDGTSMAS